MAIGRVAIIFDQVRPDTTGVYCRSALTALADSVHYRPDELARIPPGRFDLYLNIDDGLRYRLPADLRPCAWWAIDTHLDLDWHLAKAPDFDRVFTAQRDGAERLRRAGIDSVTWLPLACDPAVHRRHEVPRSFDVAFVGHVFPGPRADLLRLIQRHFPASFVGQRFFDDMARTYSASKVVFNRSIRNDVNMRVFEAVACGSLLMTNDLADNGQAELFRDGVHLATYGEAEELREKLAFYLGRDELRERIAARGRAEALERHTYRHRIEVILRAAEAAEARATVPGPGRPRRDGGGSAAEFGLTSIVIVTHNQLEYTRLCLDSLTRLTAEPIELIVVDNGSTDGTVEDLQVRPGVRLIANATNRGFPAAANQGIAASRGCQVLLLNNDTIVTPGWLGRLLRALHGDPAIGLAGPCSNCVSGPQQVEAAYDSLADLEAFARDWGPAHDRLIEDIDRLVGFCLLIRREVIDAVGLLDEQFGIGCFEDDDYCLRAIGAGYRAVIARDAFVHHFGGRTFLGTGVDFAAVMGANQRRFLAKWAGSGFPPGTGRAPGPGALPARPSLPRRPAVLEVDTAPGGGLRLRPRAPRLSLCMIVRDSATTLPACLASIRPWVDEMVIVDTGSVDATPRVVESFGGRLFHFPWCDDFSAARNQSLRHARGEWIFWLDSDDTIPPECGRRLRRLIDGALEPNLLGFVMQVHCPGRGEDGDRQADLTVVDHVKLFRNRPDLRFDGRIHEQILPAIRGAGGAVAWTDLYVVHSGSDPSPAAQEPKRRRDLRLLHLELAERPDHPFTLFNLGMTYVDGSQFAVAADYLRRSIARSGPEESHLRKAYALLVYAGMRRGDRAAAEAACRRGRELFPRDAELQFREGVLLHDLGRLEEARRAYREVLANDEERHFTSVDRGLGGFKARQNLAVVAADLGELAEAERQWRQVVAEMPRYRPGWRGLGETLIGLGRRSEARALAAELADDPVLGVEGWLLKGRIAQAEGDIPAARTALDRAAAERPDDLEVLRGRCQLLFEHGEPDEAEAALRCLLAEEPEDASTHFNLGTVLLRTGRPAEAALAYRQALRYRPDHPATYLHLGSALRSCGRPAEAAAAWEQASRLRPADPPDVGGSPGSGA